MLRSLLCSCLALLLCGIVGLAGEVTGIISEVKDPGTDKATVVFWETKGKEKSDKSMNLTVTKDTKILKATFDKEKKELVTAPIEGGLKAEAFSKEKLGDKGVRVKMTFEGDKLEESTKITEIRTFGGKGGK